MQVMDPPEWNPPFSCYCTTWTESVPGDPSQSDLQEVLHVTKTYYQRLAKQTRRCQMQQAWVLKWGRRACFFRFCISKILKPDIVNISLFFFCVCFFKLLSHNLDFAVKGVTPSLLGICLFFSVWLSQQSEKYGLCSNVASGQTLFSQGSPLPTSSHQ